jgi:4-hydroxy-tetrahydrodipicolinate reductase
VAPANLRKCFAAGVPVVCGTTGWTAELPAIQAEMKAKNATLFWSSNYSIGVNIFSAVNKFLAKIMNRFPDYDVKMSETHHIHKLDAPSGTAITLAEGILDNLDRKNKWVKGTLLAADGTLSGTEQCKADELPISSERRGEVPGIHSVTYESAADTITITHDAKSREGFAMGAVLAAEFTAGKKGFFGMNDMLDFLK